MKGRDVSTQLKTFQRVVELTIVIISLDTWLANEKGGIKENNESGITQRDAIQR